MNRPYVPIGDEPLAVVMCRPSAELPVRGFVSGGTWAAMEAERKRNWQVALDALVEDAPGAGLDAEKVREKVLGLMEHYKSDRVRYDVIRHMHDAMLRDAHGE